MPSPVQTFLLERAPGYADLTQPERDAINDFALLWPWFEGSIVGPQGAVSHYLQIPETLGEMGLITNETLKDEIAYFKTRYYRDGAYTEFYPGLHVERTNLAAKKAIREFLESGPEYPVIDAIKGVLLICLRLRNNLFHGTKALYGIAGQLSNFQNACNVVICLLSLHPPRY